MSTATLETVTETNFAEIYLVGRKLPLLLGEQPINDSLFKPDFTYEIPNLGIIERKKIPDKEKGDLYLFRVTLCSKSSKILIKRLEKCRSYGCDPKQIRYSLIKGKFPRNQIGEVLENTYQ